MKSNLAKVLHPLGGRPMLSYPLKLAKQMKAKRILVVIGHQGERVRATFQDEGVKFVEQKEQKGTGHAVWQTKKYLGDFSGNILVLYGDVPLLREETVEQLTARHKTSKAYATLLTVILKNPAGYGRIVRDERGNFLRIVEDRDANAEEKKTKEINTGIGCFKAKELFATLRKVKPDNKKNEYYLTDVFGILKKEGKKIETSVAKDPQEVMGLNDRKQLAVAETVLQRHNS